MIRGTKFFKPPFSYERRDDRKKFGRHILFRIHDSEDNAIARTYHEENAKMLVEALNLYCKEHKSEP